MVVESMRFDCCEKGIQAILAAIIGGLVERVVSIARGCLNLILLSPVFIMEGKGMEYQQKQQKRSVAWYLEVPELLSTSYKFLL